MVILTVGTVISISIGGSDPSRNITVVTSPVLTAVTSPRVDKASARHRSTSAEALAVRYVPDCKGATLFGAAAEQPKSNSDASTIRTTDDVRN